MTAPTHTLEGALDAIQETLDQTAASAGKRLFRNGAMGYGHRPTIAPDAWCHITFPPVDEAAICDLERGLGMQLPGMYRGFLSWSNGLHLFGNSLHVFGHRVSYDRSPDTRQPFDVSTPNVDERPRDARADAVFVAAYGFDGSMVYITNDAEEAILCRRGTAAPVCSWPSFASMLHEEVTRLAEAYSATEFALPPPV